MAFAIVTTTTVWLTNKLIIVKVGKIKKWKYKLKQKILIQFSINILQSSIIVLTFAYTFIVIIFNEPTSFDSFLLIEFPISFLWVGIINFIYLIYDIQRISHEKNNKQPAYYEPVKIEVYHKDKCLIIRSDSIAVVHRQNKINYIYSFEGNRHISTKSIKDLIKILPRSEFFLANRQSIVSKNAILGYEITETRKLKLQFKNHGYFKENIYVSKEKSAAFKKFLNN